MNWSSAELDEIADDWNLEVPSGLRDISRNPEVIEAGSLHWVPRADAEMATFAERVLDVIYNGPGVCLLHGSPLENEESARGWLWRLAAALGHPVPQSTDGAMTGRVEDLRADHANPTHRGHKTSAALAFHSDRTDVIVLFCLRNAAQGGQSQIASVERVRSILAAERPELLAVLEKPFPYDRRGEERPGEAGWTQLPVLSEVKGEVVARYIRRFIESSQRHPEAPRLTSEQVAAMDAVDEVLSRPEVMYEMDLKAGQIQLIENHKIMHARSAFHGGDRLLLRLWLSTSRSPELPAEFSPVYGSTAAGTIRGGVWPVGTETVVGTPVPKTLIEA